MSLYNLMNGVNSAVLFVLPMLGKHPSQYPRFRDCFVGEISNSDEFNEFGIPLKKVDDQDVISVFTRVGGGNREGYATEIKELRSMPTYIKDYDDDFDSTFATFVFGVPEKWQNDFKAYKNVQPASKEYIEEILRMYPDIAEKFKHLF